MRSCSSICCIFPLISLLLFFLKHMDDGMYVKMYSSVLSAFKKKSFYSRMLKTSEVFCFSFPNYTLNFSLLNVFENYGTCLLITVRLRCTKYSLKTAHILPPLNSFILVVHTSVTWPNLRTFQYPKASTVLLNTVQHLHLRAVCAFWCGLLQTQCNAHQWRGLLSSLHHVVPPFHWSVHQQLIQVPRLYHQKVLTRTNAW